MTIQKTTDAVIQELKKYRMLKNNDTNAHKKTEILLYNYNKFKTAIDEKLEQIQCIQAEGIAKKSKSITSCSTTFEFKSDDDKADEKIQSLEAAIVKTNDYIKMIDAALSKISNDPYFNVISMKYFEGMTREQIAEEYNVDVSTISRNKNRLINILKITLFLDDSILEMFGVA